MIKLPDEKKSVFVAAQFRSGSTHLTLSLLRALKLKWVSTCNGGLGDCAQNIEHSAASILFPHTGLIYQQHAMAHTPNVERLKAFGMFPIVTTRNIFDSVLSTKEQIDRSNVMPGLYVPHAYRDYSEDKKWAWVVANAASWIASFNTSWAEVDYPHYVVHYEEYHKDQVGNLTELLRLMGYGTAKRDKLELVCGQKDGRLHKGISGRGLKEIPPEHLESIRRVLEGYPEKVVEELVK